MQEMIQCAQAEKISAYTVPSLSEFSLSRKLMVEGELVPCRIDIQLPTNISDFSFDSVDLIVTPPSEKGQHIQLSPQQWYKIVFAVMENQYMPDELDRRIKELALNGDQTTLSAKQLLPRLGRSAEKSSEEIKWKRMEIVLVVPFLDTQVQADVSVIIPENIEDLNLKNRRVKLEFFGSDDEIPEVDKDIQLSAIIIAAAEYYGLTELTQRVSELSVDPGEGLTQSEFQTILLTMSKIGESISKRPQRAYI